MTASQPTEPGRQPLLSQRSALILLIAACIGIGIGILTSMSGEAAPTALTAGLLAAGSCIAGLNNLIGP